MESSKRCSQQQNRQNDSPAAIEVIKAAEIKPYCCRRCKTQFEFKRELLLHNKTQHIDPLETPFVCDVCTKRFANHGNLYRHMKSHNDVRPHECDICGKSFAQNVNLQRHYSVHNGVRPFQCMLCSKSFTQQGNLRRHELTHTGEKPFHCKRCGRMFSQRINLKKHVMMHQGYKPYACEICNKTFLQLQNLKKHQDKHHVNSIRRNDEQANSDETTVVVMELIGEENSNLTNHSNNLIYDCNVCVESFTSFSEFQEHQIFCDASGEANQTTIESSDMSNTERSGVIYVQVKREENEE